MSMRSTFRVPATGGRAGTDLPNPGWLRDIDDELPVGNLPNLAICNAVGEAGHRVRANVAAVGHDDSQDLAHRFSFPLSLLAGRHELVGEVA